MQSNLALSGTTIGCLVDDPRASSPGQSSALNSAAFAGVVRPIINVMPANSSPTVAVFSAEQTQHRTMVWATRSAFLPKSAGVAFASAIAVRGALATSTVGALGGDDEMALGDPSLDALEATPIWNEECAIAMRILSSLTAESDDRNYYEAASAFARFLRQAESTAPHRSAAAYLSTATGSAVATFLACLADHDVELKHPSLVRAMVELLSSESKRVAHSAALALVSGGEQATVALKVGLRRLPRERNEDLNSLLSLVPES